MPTRQNDNEPYLINLDYKPPLLNAEQAARLLEMSVGSVRDCRELGRLPSVRATEVRCVFYRGDIEKYTKYQRSKEIKHTDNRKIDLGYLPPLLKCTQVANILGVSTRIIRIYRKLGIIPSVRIGKNRYRFLSKDIREYVNKRYVTNPFEEEFLDD